MAIGTFLAVLMVCLCVLQLDGRIFGGSFILYLYLVKQKNDWKHIFMFDNWILLLRVRFWMSPIFPFHCFGSAHCRVNIPENYVCVEVLM